MKSEPTSILAFRNGSIGNTLVAVPALRAIRKRYPHALLAVVVDRVGFELLEHCPWIDELVIYDKRGTDRGMAAHWRLLRRLRKLRPSHAVLFKRFYRNGLMAFLSGASVRAGFETDGEAPFLNLTIPYDNAMNVVDLNMRLAALLGAEGGERRVTVYLTDEDRRQAEAIVGDAGPYRVAHYGGSTTAPDFLSPARFVELLEQATAGEHSLVLIGSGKRESEQAAELARVTGGFAATNLPLRVMSAIIERAGLFVGFNSGPAHIAAAVRTPEIVLYKPGATADNEIRKWKPAAAMCAALVPPEADSEAEWMQFREQFTYTIAELTGAKQPTDGVK